MKKFTLVALAMMASASCFAQTTQTTPTTLWDGEDTKITKLGENKYYAKLPVEDSPTFWGWIFMLEDRIRILSPSHLVKEYSEKLDRMRKIVKCV